MKEGSGGPFLEVIQHFFWKGYSNSQNSLRTKASRSAVYLFSYLYNFYDGRLTAWFCCRRYETRYQFVDGRNSYTVVWWLHIS
jgi:hypothetical protein